MTNDNEIAKIVAGLSEMHRKAILCLDAKKRISREIGIPGPALTSLFYGTSGICIRGTLKPAKSGVGMVYSLTPLGLAVRDALQREKAHE